VGSGLLKLKPNPELRARPGLVSQRSNQLKYV